MPDSASLSAPVIATGRLVAEAGEAGGTPVVLRAWPTATDLTIGDTVQAPVVARARAAGDGAFVLRSPLTPELARFAEACEPAVRAALDGDCPSRERLFEQNRRERGE